MMDEPVAVETSCVFLDSENSQVNVCGGGEISDDMRFKSSVPGRS